MKIESIPLGRWRLVGGGLLLVTLGVLTAVAYGAADDPALVHAEGGPVERSQIALLVAGACAAFVRAAMAPGTRARAWMFWIGVMASLIVAREIDAHVALNPETIGRWGVRYRIDWWFDGAVSPALKLLWASIAVVIGALVVAPLVIARPDGVGSLRQRRALQPWLLTAGIGLYAAGYASDDLLGRGAIAVDLETLRGIEEGFELAGALIVLLATLAAYRVADDGRPSRSGAPA